MPVLAVTADIAAQLKRSTRRRTIGIKVSCGKVIVSAPTMAPLKDIEYFVRRKKQWIQRHLTDQQAKLLVREEKQYSLGESIPYLGKPIALVCEHDGLSGGIAHYEHSRATISLSEFTYQNALNIRKLILEQWYVGQAVTYLKNRVNSFAKVMGVRPMAIKVRYYKSRWGSCNSRGELQFNWLILMAPPEVIDYVVVHELAHLKHFNHSPAFWQVVESVILEHKQHRAWLKHQTDLVW